MYLFTTFALVTLSITPAVGNNSSIGSQLYNNLFLNYEKNVRPGINYSYPTIVSCEFSFAGLNEFKEIDSKMSVLGVFIIQWYEDRLVWNPATYGGISDMLIPEESVWKPDIAIPNAYHGVKFLYSSNPKVRAKNNGHIIWVTGDRYDLYCNADITHYPFDTQTCVLSMLTWNSFPSEVLLDKVESISTLRNYTSINPSWDVTEIKMYSRIDETLVSSTLIIEIKVKRLPEYVIVNMLLPVCFLCVINIFVFILPAESGERIGFSITLLLSVAVFMTILSDSLPQSSRPQIAVLCYFLFSQLIVSILMMVFTILGLRFYWAVPDKPIPGYLKLFSRIMSNVCKGTQYCKRRKKRKQLAAVGPEQIQDTVEKECNIKNSKDMNQSPLEDECMLITWQKIASDFDNFCIVLFLFLIVLTNSVFCINMSSNTQ
ncbi:neuronal acetylcholine receptor subunit alpha-3-like [Ylistrum balloti]|uniref:neuronal acetylcholine receptor subunit alpha-3-like n=1 Tax=Ylistrum balloti TaxID=509963 RepID=UPI002905E3FC|nr:neuronal acetylcholine receptor subunit alpha-3-like [Ylistrum balloti]